MYNECLCLGCKDRINDNVNVNDDVMIVDNIDQGTCFAEIKDNTDDNFNINDNVNENVNFINNVNDNVNDNVNVNTNDNRGTCFAADNANATDNQGTRFADDNFNDNKNNNDSDKDDDDKFIFQFGDKHPMVEPIPEAVGEPRAKPISPITYNSWRTKDFVPYTNNISMLLGIYNHG